MKKSLILLLILIIAGGTAVIGFGSKTLDTADKVVYEETVYCGDPSAAEGLCLRFYNHYLMPYEEGARYLWTTDMRFSGGGFEAETSVEYTHRQFETEVPIRIGVSKGLHYGNKNRERIDQVVKNYREENADIIKSNGSVHKKLHLSVLYDYYPLYIYVTDRSVVGDLSMTRGQKEYGDEELQRRFDDYFRIPIEDDLYVDLAVFDNGFDVEESQNGGSYLLFVTGGSFCGGNSIYFYINYIHWDGQQYTKGDYSQVPGGYGVYKLDYSYEDGLWIDTDSLSTLCSFGEDTLIEQILGSETADVIYVFAIENGDHSVYTVDCKSGEILQKTDICPYGRNNVYFAQKEDGYIIFGEGKLTGPSESLGASGSLTVLEERDDGLLECVLTADLGELSGYGYRVAGNILSQGALSENSGLANLYQYGKLYIAAPDISTVETGWLYNKFGCGISVYIYDGSGLQFFGNYASSLGKNSTGTDLCTWINVRPEIRLEVK